MICKACLDANHNECISRLCRCRECYPSPMALKSREAIIANARRIAREIELDLNSIASWNENVRKPGEAPIDVEEYDPGGHLRRYAEGLRRMLASDPGHGPIAVVPPPQETIQ